MAGDFFRSSVGVGKGTARRGRTFGFASPSSRFGSASPPRGRGMNFGMSRRRRAARLIGLTTTPELGWKAVTVSRLSSVTSNPWNGALTSGGSSGWAAVAAAIGAGALHLGTDGGGSIRIPASFTGIVGHKPSFGKVPAFPPSGFGNLAHIGPMARNVRGAKAMLDAISGRDASDWYQPPIEYPAHCARSA